MNIDLERYSDFVKALTSDESTYYAKFINRITYLDSEVGESDVLINPVLLLTAAIGLSAECGEFAELPKKIVFQGKPLNNESLFHMKRELGDIMFYWINACRSLGLDPNDVIAENVRKLESRYPGGKFDPYFSENRKDGDL